MTFPPNTEISTTVQITSWKPVYDVSPAALDAQLAPLLWPVGTSVRIPTTDSNGRNINLQLSEGPNAGQFVAWIVGPKLNP